MKRTIQSISIETTIGDIANQADIKAVVNAANKDLKTGGGVAGALHRKAGKKLEEACRPFAPIEVTEVIMTKGFDLPNDTVLHALGPRFGVDNPSDKLLKRTYDNVFNLLKRRNIDSVALPAISIGAFGYPKKDATIITLRTLKSHLLTLNQVKTIRFVLYDEDTYNLYNRLIDKIFDETL